MENQKTSPPSTSSPGSKALSIQTRQELGAQVAQGNNETSITAIATKARAEIESALIMARKFPRNEEDVRVRVLRTCHIPSFAEKARYKKPKGKTRNTKTGEWEQNYIIGPSIRLAEELFRQWGNILFESNVLYEDSDRRIISVRAMDLQTLATSVGQFIVEKTVERKNAKGRIVLSERLNSEGEKVSIVVATEDEMLEKQNALSSKYRRNLIMQLIPTYLLQDALTVVDEARGAEIKQDPSKAKKDVVDNFAKVGVMPSELEKYLGHPLAQLIPNEINELKDIFNALVEGEATWAEIIEEKKIETKTIETAILPGNPEFARKPGENEWEYEERIEKLEQQKQAEIFKPGDPATHQDVKSVQSKITNPSFNQKETT